MMFGNDFNIAELDVVDFSGLTMRNRRTTAAGNYLTALEANIVDIAEGLRSDLQAAVARCRAAVFYNNVRRGTVLHSFGTGLDDDGIVRAHDVAITNLDMAAMVHVNSIAVRNIHQVADPNPINKNMFAAKQMKSPLWSMTERDFADLDVPATT